MNKEKLDKDLVALINFQTETTEKLFLQVLRQVWMIDWNVPAYDIYMRFFDMDVSYVNRFMIMDSGDEEEENQLMINWVRAYAEIKNGFDSNKLIGLIDQVNKIRLEANI